MEEKELNIENTIRWFGKKSPEGLAWIGLAILELACAVFILGRVYMELDTYIGKEPEVSVKEIVDYVNNTGTITRE